MRRLRPQPWLRAVGLWGAPSPIASVQRGTIAVASTSGTATITAVDTNNSRIVFLGSEDTLPGTTPNNIAIRVELTNATTVTAFLASASTVTITFEVIEYRPGIIKRIQRGTDTTAGVAVKNVTISEVDLAKTTLDNLGFTTTYSGATNAGYVLSRMNLSLSTNLRFDSLGAIDRTFGYQIVEWN
jgi:hypothetical protein